MRIVSTLPARRPPRHDRNRPSSAVENLSSGVPALPRRAALVPVLAPPLLPPRGAAPFLAQGLGQDLPRVPVSPAAAAYAYARTNEMRDRAPPGSLVA